MNNRSIEHSETITPIKTEVPVLHGAKVENVDLTTFVCQLLLATCENLHRFEENLKKLTDRSKTHYLLQVTLCSGIVFDPMDSYCKNSYHLGGWSDYPGDVSELRIFGVEVTHRVGNRAFGHLTEMDFTELCKSEEKHSIDYAGVTATLKNGEEHSFTNAEWEQMSITKKLKFQKKTHHYDFAEQETLKTYLAKMMSETRKSAKAVRAEEFLTAQNSFFMSRADVPQYDMYRIPQTVAKQLLLAKGEAEVYRLLPEGPCLLNDRDVTYTGLHYGSHSALAIKKNQTHFLENWCTQAVEKFIDKQTRPKLSRNDVMEL